MANVATAVENDCVITVTNKIHFKNNGIPKKDFDEVVKKIKEELKKVWEDPEFKFGCCKVKFTFVYSNAEGDDTDTKNLHPGNGVSSQSGHGPGQSTGTWFPLAIGNPGFGTGAAAHEMGHELGMRDKYECFDAAGNKIDCYVTAANGKRILNPNYKGKRPTAGYPRDGIAFDRKGTPKQQDIDEIINGLGVTCPEECCKKDKKVSYLLGGAGTAVAILVAILVYYYSIIPKE